jgi:hypothetical protein
MEDEIRSKKKRRRTYLEPECIRETKRKHTENYQYYKFEGLTLPTPKKKRIQSEMTAKKWNALSAAERWELMNLTELTREIAAMFPGKSFGHVRLLKEQGRLPDDFGKRKDENNG